MSEINLPKEQDCFNCLGKSVLCIEQRTFTYKKHDYIVKFPVYKCSNCGEDCDYTTAESDQVWMDELHRLHKQRTGEDAGFLKK